MFRKTPAGLVAPREKRGFSRLIPLGLPLLAPNPLFPACVGIRPSVSRSFGSLGNRSSEYRRRKSARIGSSSKPPSAKMDQRVPRVEIIGVLGFVLVHARSNDQVGPPGPVWLCRKDRPGAPPPLAAASAAAGRNRYPRSCADEAGLRLSATRLQKESRSGHLG